MSFVLDVWKRKALMALELAGHPMLAALAWLWLSIPESSVAEVVVSALLAVAVVFGALWLHAAALAAFHPVYGALAGRALRRLPRFVMTAALITGLVLAASWIPYVWLRLAARLIALFALVPFASAAAGGAFGLRGAAGVLARWQYWLGAAVVAAAGIYAPYRLIAWVPQVEGLAAQLISIAVRVGLGYALAVLAWLTLAALIGRLGARGSAA